MINPMVVTTFKYNLINRYNNLFKLLLIINKV